MRIPLTQIQELTNKAEESRSASGAAKAQRIIATWAQLEATKSAPDRETTTEVGVTDQMIEKARAAISLSRSGCDRYAELVSMNVYAWFLATRFENTKSAEAFREAENICQMAEHIVQDFERNLVPAFCDTYAKVLSFDLLNRASLMKAKELADKSMQLRETTHVHRTLARIVELLDGD